MFFFSPKKIGSESGQQFDMYYVTLTPDVIFNKFTEDWYPCRLHITCQIQKISFTNEGYILDVDIYQWHDTTTCWWTRFPTCKDI